MLHPGYVRTDITGGDGFIDTDESVRGMLSVLESGRQLSGSMYDYKGQLIPW